MKNKKPMGSCKKNQKVDYNNQSGIKFYFPELSRNENKKSNLAHLILKQMQEEGSIEYAGYMKDAEFFEFFFWSKGVDCSN